MHEHDYRALRRDFGVPARLALTWVRRKQRLAEWGLAWQSRPDGWPKATWTQAGFDLTAVLEPDPDGGFAQALETLGHFTDRWAPGAVRHRRGHPHRCRWFVPVDPEQRHVAYRRACDYGDGWSSVGLAVRAGRAGVSLGEASLWGLESDAGEDFWSETALELADDAIARARETLHALCDRDCLERPKV